MKGLFIPEITAEMFRNGCLEGIEALMAEGEIYDIDYTGWIPVSDDTLPDTDIDVNATLKDFAETRTGFFADEEWWLITKEGTLENYPLGYVIAWKPLPKPYKEGDSE